MSSILGGRTKLMWVVLSDFLCNFVCCLGWCPIMTTVAMNLGGRKSGSVCFDTPTKMFTH